MLALALLLPRRFADCWKLRAGPSRHPERSRQPDRAQGQTIKQAHLKKCHRASGYCPALVLAIRGLQSMRKERRSNPRELTAAGLQRGIAARVASALRPALTGLQVHQHVRKLGPVKDS